ncbi:hypothetical protein JOQ06_026858 [Pogonophryne albipinna]|uniref:Plethodontid modulating factor n=1 Tax=Pogonophryne albipinna TaxID=1090488 RepID=A0AAD6B9F0_9TELE|nr:hypothetical protein JOQ06_026858 [Pogonophryne albipinna]
MKTVILTLMVLVVVSQGEALMCHCSSIPAICPGSVETCELGEVCGSIAVGVGPSPYHMRRCMKADECMRLSNAGGAYSHGRCCSRDLCN